MGNMFETTSQWPPVPSPSNVRGRVVRGAATGLAEKFKILDPIVSNSERVRDLGNKLQPKSDNIGTQLSCSKKLGQLDS